MKHILSFGSAQSQYDNMMPEDTSAFEAAVDREAEEIKGDRERLLDILYAAEECNDPADNLAKLQVTLRNASYALDRIFRGESFADVTTIKYNMDALRELVRAADAAYKLVDSRVLLAATQAVEDGR